MSISLKTIRAERGHCPRGCGSQTTIVSYTDFECRRCGLTFSARRPKQAQSSATMTHGSKKLDTPSIDDRRTILREHYKPAREFGPVTHDQLVARKDAVGLERKELGMLKRVHLLKHKVEASALRITPKQEDSRAPFTGTTRFNQTLSEKASTNAPHKTMERSTDAEEVSAVNLSLKRASQSPLAPPKSGHVVEPGRQATKTRVLSAPREMISCSGCIGSWLRSDIDRFFPHLISNGRFKCSACSYPKLEKWFGNLDELSTDGQAISQSNNDSVAELGQQVFDSLNPPHFGQRVFDPLNPPHFVFD